MKKLFGLLILVGAALSLTAFRMNSGSTAAHPEYQTEPIEFGTIVETVSATGVIQFSGVVAIGVDSPGRVVRTFVEVNQTVKANEILAQLDDRIAQLRLQQAKVGVELALADVQRAEAARDLAMLAVNRAREPAGNSIAPRDLETSELQYRGALAALSAAQFKVRDAQTAQLLAEQAVEMTSVRSPIAGTVIEKRVTTGQQAAPPTSAHLFTVAPDLERAQVVAHVSDGDIAKLKVGQQARFTVNAYADHTFEGSIIRIAAVPVGAPGAVHYPVTIEVVNSKNATTRQWRLKSGMTASVDVAVRRHEQVWKMPSVASTVQLEESRLTDSARKKIARWKARSDVAEWQRVWSIDANGRIWPVYLRTGGVTADGEPGIQDNQSTEVITWDPEESAPAAGSPLRVLVATPDHAKPPPSGLKLF